VAQDERATLDRCIGSAEHPFPDLHDRCARPDHDVVAVKVDDNERPTDRLPPEHRTGNELESVSLQSDSRSDDQDGKVDAEQ
jgi:hypothetical protein